MIIFSTIVAILSPILYLLPFIIKWAKKEEVYKFPTSGKIIPNKWVFLTKLVVLALLIIAFVFMYPSKIMFYPMKTLIFIGILLVLPIVTGPIFCIDWINNIQSDKEIFKQWMTYWIILFVLGLLILCSYVTTGREISNYQECEESVEYYVQSINSSGLVSYHDENGLQVLSITDENVSIEDSDEIDTHIEKKITYQQYCNKYDKDSEIIRGNVIQEEYTVYIPEKILNDLMK